MVIEFIYLKCQFDTLMLKIVLINYVYSQSKTTRTSIWNRLATALSYEGAAGRTNWLAGYLGHWKLVVFVVNRMLMFTKNHVPEVAEVTTVHVSEGQNFSKIDLTLCTNHRAGRPDYSMEDIIGFCGISGSCNMHCFAFVRAKFH